MSPFSSEQLRSRLSELLPRLTDAVPRGWLVTLNRFPALRSWARSGVDVLARRTTPTGVRQVVVSAGPLQGLRLVLDFEHEGERAIWLVKARAVGAADGRDEVVGSAARVRTASAGTEPSRATTITSLPDVRARPLPLTRA